MADLVRLKAVGDIMLGDGPVCYGHGIRSSIEAFGFDYLFKNIQVALDGSDVLFGNLESVLSDRGRVDKVLARCEMRGKPEHSAVLSRAGFNLMSLANNHAMQHGLDAFHETVDVLSREDIFCLGLNDGGLSNVFNYKKGDIEISFIGYSLRKEKYYPGDLPYASGDESTIIRQVTSLRDSGKIVVVSLHWGDEYVNFPSAEQVRLGHRLIDSGAALILGHHPHVLQGIENYNNGHIVYSLGNFIFDKWQKAQRETMLIDCFFNKEGIQSLSTIPVKISRSFQPEIASGADFIDIDKKIKNFSEGISSQEDPSYRPLVEKRYLKFRLESYFYFIRNIYKYKSWVTFQSFSRFLVRRIQG